jgi:glutamate racemase
VTIVVTDSGLGGLSVCAELERRVREDGLYRKARILFANALPEAGQGYNRMRTSAEKVAVFEAALKGIVRWCAPDVILVACNTLSVLLPEIRFARESSVPILGIVETGVEALAERLRADPAAVGMIFGTETTIGSGMHKLLLVEQGIAPDRLITQQCPDLAGRIEATGKGASAVSAIEGFVAQALAQREVPPPTVYAGLCCTHYGYCAEVFEASLRSRGVSTPVIVNPNTRMVEILFDQRQKGRFDHPDIQVEVISRARISPEEQASIAGLVEPVSPPTAAALRSYSLKRDLFPYQPFRE